MVKLHCYTSCFLTEVSFISLTEIQNARGIMDVLSEMLNAIDPGNKEVLVCILICMRMKTFCLLAKLIVFWQAHGNVVSKWQVSNWI